MDFSTQKTCTDCGDPWAMMREPIAHRKRGAHRPDAVCHACYHRRLGEDRKAQREDGQKTM